MITVIDYTVGNLASVAKAFRYLGHEVAISADPDEIARARRLVLPGVGNFAATAQLEHQGIREAILSAIASGGCFLGICLGMQWLCEASTEAPGVRGLGVLAGICDRFPGRVKSPHVGWNSIEMTAPSRLLLSIKPGTFVYFTHSYRLMPGPSTVAVSSHGGEFSAVEERDNVFGVQFHPEKSAAAGLAILRNFAELPC